MSPRPEAPPLVFAELPDADHDHPAIARDALISGSANGARLRALRGSFQLSTLDLAGITKLGRSSIGQIERGVMAPRAASIFKLAEALSSNPAYLYGLTEFPYDQLDPLECAYMAREHHLLKVFHAQIVACVKRNPELEQTPAGRAIVEIVRLREGLTKP